MRCEKMKSMKIFGVLVIILVAVTFLGVVSAAEVTVGDQSFNLPDGFKENTTAAKEKMGSSGSKTYVKSFVNDEGKTVTINVIVAPEGTKKVSIDPQPGYVNKTINGVTGNYNGDVYRFEYLNGTTQILIAANGDSLIEGFIKA